MTKMSAVETIQGRKIARFGVEAPQALVWKGWEPGREYTKSLILKNVQFKTQKLKYRLPSHSFSTEYPQTIVLSAGTSYTLPITFRPLEKKEYDECIEFQTAGHSFAVPFKAQLPAPNLSLPESVTFGMCGVKDLLVVKLSMTNTGDTPAEFHWDVPAPFEVQPSSGTLDMKETCQLSAIFSPNVAHAYEVKAVCRYGHKNQFVKSVKLEGVGKYPCLKAELVLKKTKKTAPSPASVSGGCPSELVVNFNDVPVADKHELNIDISNVSSVVGHFTLVPLPQGDLHDPVFTCSVTEGSIPPQSSRRVKIIYTPHTPDLTSVSYFELVTQGGVNRTRIKCVGKCLGPCVRVSEECLSFGNIECGRSSTGVLRVRNDSPAPALFKIGLDNSSVFSSNVLCGHVGGGATQSVSFTFNPPRPMGYHRRVTILVQHHPPLLVDLIGNAYTETVKPALVLPKHLNMFVQRVKNGLSRYSPEQIQQMVSQGKVTVGGDGSLHPSDDMTCSPSTAYTVTESLYERVLSEETGLDAGGLPHVSCDVQEVQFDYCKERETSESKVVNVCNHTEGKMMCIWTYGSEDVFQVVPEEREIHPGKVASFTLTFRPKKPSQFYVQEMECFVFYKSLRDHRQVADHSISPPWCLTVRAIGHSFAPSTEVFVPKIAIDSRNMLMPPAQPHQSVYKTLAMKNVGDSSVLYHFQPDPQGIFTIKPERGLLQDYQVFIVKMKPQENKTYKHVMPLKLNLTDKFAQNILVSGSGEVPSVKLENDGHVFFRPTCIGDHSNVSHRVLNTSRLPLSYQWRLDSDRSGPLVSVSPISGVIQPFEGQYHQWTFSPRESQPYKLSAVLHVSATNQIKSRSHKESVVLHGQGCLGELSCEPGDVDFGTTVIGTSASHKLTLTNPAPCNIHYQLTTEEVVQQDGRSTRRAPGSSHGLQLSSTEGVLPGGSQSIVTVTIRPWRTGCVHMDINYKLLLSEDSSHSEKRLCSVKVQGVYPSLTVVDVQGEGSAATHSKSTLWRMLSVDRLIHCLNDEPSIQELRYAIATRHSTRRRVEVKTRASVDFNFGIAPIGSKPSTVHLMLLNDGPSPTDWAFQFPEDMYLEPEYWADKGDLDETEQHELHLTSHKIFQVEPKSGTLQPHQQERVTLTCRHEQIIKAKLPILLKIDRGREIMVNFLSQTIAKEDTLIDLPAEHTFAPVPVGTTAPPRQKFVLYNGGELGVSYTIHTSPLVTLKKENFMMDILECLQPQGEIPPHGSVDIEFVFSPLEAKRYVVDLSVELSNSQYSQVMFIGDGVLVSALNKEQQGQQRAPSLTAQEDLLPIQQDSTHTPVHRMIQLPGQLASISKELVNFGHISLFSCAREVIHLTNTSSHTVSFKWDVTDEAANILTIEPKEGYLQPSCSLLCRVAIYSRMSPAFHNLDVLCKVMDETRYSLYCDELSKWEEQQEENKHLFTLTDKNLHRSEGRPQTMPTTGTPPKMRSSYYSEVDIKKYQALPPIRSQTANSTSEEFYEDWKKKDMSTRSKARPRARRRVEAKCPVPPEPYILHLGVVARTHSIADCVRFVSTKDSITLDSHILGRDILTDPGDNLVTDCEKDLLTDIMTHLIRDSISDSDFTASLLRMSQEDMPYFSQFVSTRRPSQHSAQTLNEHVHPISPSGLDTGREDDVGAISYEVESIRVPHPQQDSSFAVSEPLPSEDCHGRSRDHTFDVLDDNSTLPFPSKEVLEEEESLKKLPEFQHLARAILENTVMNIMKEATCGEVDLRHPVKAITRPSQPLQQTF